MKSRVTETCQNRVWTCWFMLQATTTIRSGQAWSQHAGGPSHWCHFPLPPQMPSQENWIRSRAATTWTGIKQRMLASQLNSLYHFIFQFLINLFIWKEESHTERKRQREFFHSDMVATARTRPGQRQFFPRSGQCHFFSKVYQVDGRGFAQYFLPYLCVSICLKGTATDTHHPHLLVHSSMPVQAGPGRGQVAGTPSECPPHRWHHLLPPRAFSRRLD